VGKLEKGDDKDALTKKQVELKSAKETLVKAETNRQQTAEMEKRSKMVVEVARRLMHGESRLLPAGGTAKVTSTLGTRESKTHRLLGEAEPLADPNPNRDPREYVVEWLRKPGNPYFARAIVNRVWAHYFGRGIIDPPDNLSAFNPATHPELLKELCDGFIAQKYDLRWLHRTILQSRTYQQSSKPQPGAESDRTHYASFPLRRLPAEVLLDALNSATGTTENMDMKFYHWPEKMKIVQVPFSPKNAFVTHVLETYGRPQRNSAVQCDCERDGSGSIFQVLTLANHPRVWEKIKDPTGRAALVLKSTADEAGRIEELYLATVSRLPSDAEKELCLKFLKESSSPEQGVQGILWSLINTREFLLQH
jgi:hypothetical protein